MRFSILLLLLIKNSEQGVSFYEGYLDEGDVSSCVNRIVKHHFDLKHHVTILTQGSKDYVKGMESTVRLIANTFELDKTSWFSEMKQAVVFLDGDFHRDLNVLKSLEAFHPQSRFLIVSNIGDGGLSIKNYLTNLVQHLQKNRRWLVVIAVKSITENLNLYGYTKTAYGNCGNPEILNFGKCSDDESVSLLFPRIINYNKCPLRLATFDWPPWTKFVIKNGQTTSTGIESNLVGIIVERLNASEFFLDAVPSEVRKMVENHTADIGYGQMALYDGHKYSYTKSYCFVEGVLVLPKVPSRALSLFNTLMPFETTIWIAMILVVIFLIILRTFLPLFKIVSMLNILALFLSFDIKTDPTRTSQRIYLMSLILFGYIMTQGYLANLTMIFTKTDDEGGVLSIEEFERSKIPFGGPISAAKFFKDKYPRLYREYKGMSLNEFKRNDTSLKSGRGGLAMYVEVSKYINYENLKYVTQLPEIITSYPVAMVLQNSSAISSTCDWTITAIFESGIMNQWEHLQNHKKLAANAMTEQAHDNRSLDLEEFIANFQLLGVALGLSTVVFAIELLVGFWKKKKDQFH